MTTPSNCSPTLLAEVLTQCSEEITSEWRLRATQLLRDHHLDHLTVLDHMPDVIAEITRDLALRREGVLSAEHIRGSPPVHGIQRFHDGLDVGEVVAEYNLLRIAFTTVAEAHGLYLVGDAAHIINHRLDEAVRMAVTAFAAQQALIRKERGRAPRLTSRTICAPRSMPIALLVEELQETMESLRGGDAPISLKCSSAIFSASRR